MEISLKLTHVCGQSRISCGVVPYFANFMSYTAKLEIDPQDEASPNAWLFFFEI